MFSLWTAAISSSKTTKQSHCFTPQVRQATLRSCRNCASDGTSWQKPPNKNLFILFMYWFMMWKLHIPHYHHLWYIVIYRKNRRLDHSPRNSPEIPGPWGRTECHPGDELPWRSTCDDHCPSDPAAARDCEIRRRFSKDLSVTRWPSWLSLWGSLKCWASFKTWTYFHAPLIGKKYINWRV